MPQLTAITLADALGTPVNHVFNPTGRDAKNVSWLVDSSQANAVGYWRISIETVQPPAPVANTSSEGRIYRVKVGLHEPILETNGDSSASGILPAPKVAYVPRGFIEFVLPERSSLQNRKDIYKMLSNLVDNTQIKDAVENLVTFF